jgi:hypothetical protein
MPVNNISYVVRGPDETTEGAIAEVWDAMGSRYGWCSLQRLKSLFGPTQVEQWLQDDGVLWVNHSASLSSPSFKFLGPTPTTDANATSVPWPPSWSMDTIIRLRQKDYSLHADDEVAYPERHDIDANADTHGTWHG